MNIGELFVKLGFDVDDKSLTDFREGVDNLKKNLVLIPAAATAAAFAIDKFVASSVNASVALQNFNMQTGLLSANLQRYQIAGQLSDITLSADQVATSVANLQNQLVDIRLGGGNIRPFNLLGLDVTSLNAFQVLEQLRERIQGLDPAFATNLLQQIGLDRSFVNVLKLSREEFDKLGGGIVRSEETTRILVELGTQITKFKLELGLLKDEYVASIAPVLIRMLDAFRDIGEIFARSVSTLRNFTDGISGLKQVLIGLGAVAAAAFLPFTTVLASALLILEDFATYLRGGNSVIGVAIKGFAVFAQNLKRTFADPVTDAFARLIDKVDELESKFNAMKTKYMPFISFLSRPFSAIRNGADGEQFTRLSAESARAVQASQAATIVNNWNITANGDISQLEGYFERQQQLQRSLVNGEIGLGDIY